uniref:Uncharacterized protein n=1 Tax=Odontella aurita TaxID=265563 RepID=A0A7S4JQ82_9STRA|mmetsp:Transcript_51405/g.154409  ORF Transcript_51405/g.154409 Transcript_51405/m.154409 type:complete len:160 (+) Transcript_51405:129-608(+)
MVSESHNDAEETELWSNWGQVSLKDARRPLYRRQPAHTYTPHPEPILRTHRSSGDSVDSVDSSVDSTPHLIGSLSEEHDCYCCEYDVEPESASYNTTPPCRSHRRKVSFPKDNVVTETISRPMMLASEVKEYFYTESEYRQFRRGLRSRSSTNERYATI